MRNSKYFLALAIAVMALGACNSNTNDNAGTDSMAMDTAATDTGTIEQADSTHSFRNDRGTDSVSAGKSIPATP